MTYICVSYISCPTVYFHINLALPSLRFLLLGISFQLFTFSQFISLNMKSFSGRQYTVGICFFHSVWVTSMEEISKSRKYDRAREKYCVSKKLQLNFRKIFLEWNITFQLYPYPSMKIFHKIKSWWLRKKEKHELAGERKISKES